LTRKALILSVCGHAGILLLALVLSASHGPQMPTGGDAVWVDVVTLEGPPLPPVDAAAASDPEVQTADSQQDVQESPEGDVPADTTLAETSAQDPDTTQASQQETQETQNPPEDASAGQTQDFSSVTSSGEAGTGAPGPATYEGRVFAAIRRNFRTSVQPQQSFRIEFTVSPDGTVSVDTLRRSGVDAFDRAVEHALAVASIPPFPQGRTSEAVLRIEFLGTEQ
jgi:outer membrane biosynthesis protein TonB